MAGRRIFKISNEELISAVSEKPKSFPKYTTQIINIANQNAQGTRPYVVGQLSELIQECPHRDYRRWRDWYLKKYPNAIHNATQKVYSMVKKLKEATKEINGNLVKDWVEDLVIDKTFVGLKFQQAILQTIAEKKKMTSRLSAPQEESKGIDGFIGREPVSIKPMTYKTKTMLREHIGVRIIFYEKKKDGVLVDISQLEG